MNLNFIDFKTWCDRNGFDRLDVCPWCRGDGDIYDDDIDEIVECQLCGGRGWNGAVEAWDIYKRECERARQWVRGEAVVGPPAA